MLRNLRFLDKIEQKGGNTMSIKWLHSAWKALASFTFIFIDYFEHTTPLTYSLCLQQIIKVSFWNATFTKKKKKVGRSSVSQSRLDLEKTAVVVQHAASLTFPSPLRLLYHLFLKNYELISSVCAIDYISEQKKILIACSIITVEILLFRKDRHSKAFI